MPKGSVTVDNCPLKYLQCDAEEFRIMNCCMQVAVFVEKLKLKLNISQSLFLITSGNLCDVLHYFLNH